MSSCFQAGPDYVDPQLQAPADWRTAEGEVAQKDYWIERIDRDQLARRTGAELWWRQFGDSTLNTLISHARKHHPTAYLADARIREARAQRHVLASYWSPWVGTRDEIGFGEDFSASYLAALEAGWELDLFGHIGRGVEAAEAEWESAVEWKRDSLVVLTSEVALYYLAYRTLEERMTRAEMAAAQFRDLHQVLEERAELGIVPESDVVESHAQLLTREARLPKLRQDKEVAAIRLANATGIYPAALGDILEQNEGIPELPRKILLGTPAEALRNRPDVRREERKLAAQTASIGLAEAELYPLISISGGLRYESDSAGDLFSQVNRIFGFGPKLTWRIFEACRVQHRVAEEKAQTEIRLAAYQQQLLDAVAEIEIALARLQSEKEYADKQAEAAAAHEQSVAMIRESYLAGFVDIRRLLNALMDYHDTRDEEAAALGRRASFAAALFKAIGGGQLAEDPA
ncbi:efflux transporter outer membrane subunit [Roseibacillus ishigakijimensis]|uniref:Efflux transporter outer membrane subunit n=1 Tax=Roseibacillus ishigakijimensis TaxID=454146 RepID=A0A934RTG1_9BACT|nr:efflux transporter outer membrane subunit [Roseibacillus ishigakijimensis]MBK1835138.1 efflux transporter outer membrane subunit [Roseibacillus ishigakijimensis]